MTGLAKLFADIATVLNNVYGNYTVTNSKTVTGLDDVVFSGNYSGDGQTATCVIAIDSVGTTDTFSFTFNGVTQNAIPIEAAALNDLFDGIGVKFNAKTGHTLNDSWTIKIDGEKLFKTVRLYNNQIKLEQEGKYVDFAKPACFVQFMDTEDIQQGGGGMQLYNDMRVRLHICHEFYDNKLGDFEQDLQIFEIKQTAFHAIQKIEPDNAAAFVRVAENMDYAHDNIVVYTVDFKTNYEDDFKGEPYKYVIKYPPTSLEIQLIKVTPDPQPPHTIIYPPVSITRSKLVSLIINQFPDQGKYALLAFDNDNLTFTVSCGNYEPGTLQLYKDGQLLEASLWTETDPALGKGGLLTVKVSDEVYTAIFYGAQ